MTAYYFDINSGDDRNAGTSEARPWQTLAKFRDQEQAGIFQPGDTIHFRAGEVWNADRFQAMPIRTCRGTPGQPITITRYGDGPDPVIRGNRHKDRHTLFWVVGVSHWDIEHLELCDFNQGSAVMVYDSDHINVRSLYVHDCGNEGENWSGGIIFSGTAPGNGPSFCSAEGCTCEHIDGEAFYIGDAKHDDDTHDIEIRDCTAIDCLYEGIEVKSTAYNVLIAGCTLKHNALVRSCADVSLGARGNTVMENCRIESIYQRQAVFLSQYSTPHPGADCTIRGCTIDTSTDFGIRINGAKHTIESNTFVRAGVAHISVRHIPNEHGHTIRHNDFSGDAEFAIHWLGPDEASYTIEHNVYGDLDAGLWYYDSHPRNLEYIQGLGHENEPAASPDPGGYVTEQRVVELIEEMVPEIMRKRWE